MGPLELIEKLITEHGSAQILRERLELVRAQTADLERARSQAEAMAQKLQAELDETKARLEQAQSEIGRLQGGLLATHVCDHCASPRLKRVGTRPSPLMGEVGLREAVLRCEECQGATHIELPLGG